jgi:hypothetical protein
MIRFKEGGGIVVAGDVKNAVAAVDDALINGARLCASFIEATQGSNLPVSQSQKVIRSLTSGLTAVADGREEMVAAVRHMTAIKAQSNFAPEDYGCPTPWDDLFSPSAEVRTTELA